MRLFDAIRSLFGKGTIYVEGETTDGLHVKIKQHYIGDPDTLDKEELFANIIKRVQLEHSKTIKKETLKITGRIEH